MGEVGTAATIEGGGMGDPPTLTPQGPCVDGLIGEETFTFSVSNAWHNSTSYFDSTSKGGGSPVTLAVNGTRATVTVTQGFTGNGTARKNSPGTTATLWDIYWEAQLVTGGSGGIPNETQVFLWWDGNGGDTYVETSLGVHMENGAFWTAIATLNGFSTYEYDTFGESGAPVPTANVPFAVRVQVEGQDLRIKWWDLAGSEPGAWALDDAVPGSLQTQYLRSPNQISLRVGVRAPSGGGTKVGYADNFQLRSCSPQ